MFKYSEYTTEFNETGEHERVKVADWSIVPLDGKMIVERIPANYTGGESVKKIIRVDEDIEFVFKLQKTKIRAAGGASGLVAWMTKRVEQNFAICFVEKILHWTWNEMKEVR